MIDRVVGFIGDQIIAGLADPGENLGGVLKEIGLPLARIAAHETVEIVKAHADRPLIEGSGGAVLEGRRIVVLAEPRGGIAILLQNIADRRIVDADDRIIARITGRLFGDDAEADRVVIAAGDQCGAGRRAQGGRVELGIAQAGIGDAIERRRRDDAAKGTGDAIAGIVGHDEEDVGRALGRHDLRRPVGRRILGGEADLAAEGRRRVRQIAPVDGGRRVGRAGLAGGFLGMGLAGKDCQSRQEIKQHVA